VSDPKTVDVLARTLWGEARGEGERGMQAVANVIMNRADNPRWWGRTVIQVCHRPWQFSAWNKNDPNRRLLLAVTDRDLQFRLALDLATRAVNRQLPDLTLNSDHFHATWMTRPPTWARGRTPTVTIGRHVFFRLELRAPTPEVA
jgi:spore germination cell wall hydrolase CwlJ-like protein